MDVVTVDHLLTTTRTVRKRLDLTRAVDPELIQQCLEIAIQAPTGGDIPRYHFIVITDAATKAVLGELYRTAMKENYLSARQMTAAASRFFESALYLSDHFHEVPVLVQTCVERRGSAGLNTDGWELANILPAAWSLMLALRARGLGSAWTTLLAHFKEQEVATLLRIPDEIRQAAMIPVAYYTGEDFRPARRIPAHERTYWNTWGASR